MYNRNNRKGRERILRIKSSKDSFDWKIMNVWSVDIMIVLLGDRGDSYDSGLGGLNHYLWEGDPT